MECFTYSMVVTYHYLLEDAINNVLPLASPYENEVPFLQTIFVRLVDQTTGCFNTTTLDLIVKDSPQIVAPDPIVACDDDSNGIEVFDLTIRVWETKMQAIVDETINENRRNRNYSFNT